MIILVLFIIPIFLVLIKVILHLLVLKDDKISYDGFSAVVSGDNHE